MERLESRVCELNHPITAVNGCVRHAVETELQTPELIESNADCSQSLLKTI
jgi:hypothetical protein